MCCTHFQDTGMAESIRIFFTIQQLSTFSILLRVIWIFRSLPAWFFIFLGGNPSNIIFVDELIPLTLSPDAKVLCPETKSLH